MHTIIDTIEIERLEAIDREREITMGTPEVSNTSQYKPIVYEAVLINIKNCMPCE